RIARVGPSGSGLFDIDDVLETASSVILELLDEEFSEVEETQHADDAMHALHGALSPDLTSSGIDLVVPRPDDTQEVELLDDDVDDPFDATGIEFVDVDTGERLGEDVPYLETGFFEVEEDSGPVS